MERKICRKNWKEKKFDNKSYGKAFRKGIKFENKIFGRKNCRTKENWKQNLYT
jgi:hypothetical protein